MQKTITTILIVLLDLSSILTQNNQKIVIFRVLFVQSEYLSQGYPWSILAQMLSWRTVTDTCIIKQNGSFQGHTYVKSTFLSLSGTLLPLLLRWPHPDTVHFLPCGSNDSLKEDYQNVKARSFWFTFLTGCMPNGPSKLLVLLNISRCCYAPAKRYRYKWVSWSCSVWILHLPSFKLQQCHVVHLSVFIEE